VEEEAIEEVEETELREEALSEEPLDHLQTIIASTEEEVCLRRELRERRREEGAEVFASEREVEARECIEVGGEEEAPHIVHHELLEHI